MTMERKFRNPSCIPQRVCVEESYEKCCDRSEKMKEQVLNRISNEEWNHSNEANKNDSEDMEEREGSI